MLPHSKRSRHLVQLTCLLGAILLPARPARATWTFTDVTQAAGFNYTHGINGGLTTDARYYCGGVAAGDYNKDGFVDLYVVRGNIGPNLLFKNKGNGTFEEVGAQAGVNLTGTLGCGPTFADFDGDGWLDLFVGGIETTAPTLFRNLGNGAFQNATAASLITYTRDTFSSAFGDYDGDGDLDIFLTHWGAPQGTGGHLWRNNGNGTFTAMDGAAGFSDFGEYLTEFTFTPNFADYDNDNDLDLLIAADYGTSEVYRNNGNGTFTCVTSPVITDEFGMGSSLADYDNDGDLDWFVTSIWDPPSLRTGNRLYRNAGNGTFSDVTDAAGVRAGYWGWGTSFADFNNDGYLDLYQENGMRPPFEFDPARLWVSNGNATFTERSVELGINHTGEGRGVVCFDYDRDGDLDIFVANNSQAPKLFRNDGGNALNYLDVRLRGAAPNTEAIGARVFATIGDVTQMRELHAGSNYVSQDPVEAFFGCGTATTVDDLRIEWPDGDVDILHNMPVNRLLVFTQNAITAVQPAAGTGGRGARLALIGAQPNPLRSETSVRFDLGAALDVRAQVFDAAGRALRTLADGPLPPGSHALAWDGRDGGGRRLPSGIYFFRVEAGGERAEGTIAVLR